MNGLACWQRPDYQNSCPVSVILKYIPTQRPYVEAIAAQFGKKNDTWRQQVA